MTPDEVLEMDIKNDWKAQLMVQIANKLAEEPTNILPLIVPYYQSDWDMQVPQLSSILNLNIEQTPNIFVLLPASMTIIPLPEPMDDEKKFTSDTILLWAQQSILTIEIEQYEAEMKPYELYESAGSLEEEDKQKLE